MWDSTDAILGDPILGAGVFCSVMLLSHLTGRISSQCLLLTHTACPSRLSFIFAPFFFIQNPRQKIISLMALVLVTEGVHGDLRVTFTVSV